VLAGGTSASPTFVADRVGEYTVELVVSDGTASSAVDAVTLSFANLRPVADAGLSQSAILGELVSLDGSGSYDLNKGDTLTYGWSVASAPAGSAAQIGNPAAMSTAFVPDRVGSYRIQLVVSDGQLSSEPSFCEIAVVTRETQIVTDIQDAEASIASLDPVVFDNPSMQNALINKLNAVLADIGSMDPQEAINKLRNDILAKTDGCVLTGAPDKNDWIEDCASQRALYAQVQAIIDAVSLL
jgi:hypothetical protein